ncbi:ABC transporter ATP-binding protein [Anaeropeptidivorans aminofermentans]|uniref:ABC transporter ATP-binding protein n=1 Tax=Anaeropeptidivorans aminofermentans TaxID=2934315 RepID=UPI002024649E|nr:ABC transporter ATP-binding protein [Anaeropeptidivorans aminofermentans]
MSYLVLQNINKSYGKQKILQNINFSIEKGSFITLLGPSGCGKSTLLRCLAGLENIDSGDMILEGSSIKGIKPRNRNMGMIFQQYSLFPTMTVYENIAFGLSRKELTKKEIELKVTEALDIVDLKGYEKKYPSQLSGGEKQRVAIGRSIVTNPKIMLYDEPLSAIDAKLRKELQMRIKNIHEKMHMTSIFVTHDQQEAMVLSDKIFIMNEGSIIQDDSPINIYNMPKTYFAAQFIGDYNLFSEEDFLRVFQRQSPSPYAAIRPEIIKIFPKNTEEGILEGKLYTGIILDIIPHGNFIQYIVNINDYILKVHRVNDHTESFEKGENIYLKINYEDIVHLSK